MSERTIRIHLGFLALLAVGTVGRAEELATRAVSWEPRVPMGRALPPAGNLLINPRPGQAWRALAGDENVLSRDLLLALPGMRAAVQTRPQNVELTLWGNLPDQTPFAGLQSAVVLHDSRTYDLDFTLHRGRVVVANRKEKGPARIWVRLAETAIELTLNEPGDAVCLALYGFWPRGVPFRETPKADEDRPRRSLRLAVLHGQIQIKADGTQQALAAPPGPAYFQWDSVDGAAEAAERRDAVPEWADMKKESPRGEVIARVVGKYQELAKDREPRTALLDLLAAAENESDKERAKATAQFAVFGLAAINEIDSVMQALGNSKHAAVRRTAVVALRHWIGDATGNDLHLYRFLIERQSYPKAQAATILQLLHSAMAAEEPDTYETLIAYLRHRNLAIRELAWWHLTRLVPEGLQVPYDPAGSEEERAKAYSAWKERIPSGTVPGQKSKRK